MLIIGFASRFLIGRFLGVSFSFSLLLPILDQFFSLPFS